MGNNVLEYNVPSLVLESNLTSFKAVFEKLKAANTPEYTTTDKLNVLDTPENQNKYEKFDKFLQQLELKNQEYKETLVKSIKVEEAYQSLKANLTTVDEKSQKFYKYIGEDYEHYHSLLQEKDLILKYLQLFENLKEVTKKVNNFNLKFLSRKKDQLNSIMTKIFDSLDFLEAHQDFKEYETYRFHFKQQLVKFCDFIIKYLNQNFFPNLTEDITSKLSKLKEASNSDSARETLLYNKFSLYSEDFAFFQNLILESYTKYGNTKFYSNDLKSSMEQTYTVYFETRDKLLQQSIWLQIDEIILNDKNQKSLMKFIQDNILYFSSLFEKELDLFNKFFVKEFQGKNEILNDWFADLCEPFYDSSRIRIIRESNISLLCDCVTLLNKYYEFENDSMEYELQFKHIKFNKIFEPIMHDLQNRLLFKSQLYIEKNIINYKPLKTEFQIVGGKYNKLQLRNISSAEDENNELLTQYIDTLKIFNTDLNHSYYLPMLKSLALLSKLYQMVSSVVFDELAHQIVHDALASLQHAWRLSGKPTLDKTLIYLTNLMFFKEQIQNFDIQYVSTETYIDFSGFTDLWSYFPFKNSTLQSSNSEVNLENNRFPKKNETLSATISSFANSLVPRVVNNMIDARTELMTELKNTVDIFTQISINLITHNMLDLNENTADEATNENSTVLVKYLEEEIPRVYKEISTHFSDNTIRSNLILAIKENLSIAYTHYYNSIQSDKKDTEAHDDLMFPDIFKDLVSKNFDEYTNTTTQSEPELK